MTSDLNDLFDRNRAWAEATEAREPGFFGRLLKQQSPQYLWIGCADSRVPANEIVDLMPGELFVHRNVANVVAHSDLNCLSVMQYAIDHLRVKHIMVVGHYGCGGVKAALHGLRVGLCENWLRHVQDVRDKHTACLAGLADDAGRLDALCELNVLEQALNVCRSNVVQDAWLRGQELTIHGWIYGLHDGLLKDLEFAVGGVAAMQPTYRGAIAALCRRHAPAAVAPAFDPGAVPQPEPALSLRAEPAAPASIPEPAPAASHGAKDAPAEKAEEAAGPADMPAEAAR